MEGLFDRQSGSGTTIEQGEDPGQFEARVRADEKNSLEESMVSVTEFFLSLLFALRFL
jgi:hypothetical protein